MTSVAVLWSLQVHQLPSPDRDRVRWVHPVLALPVRAVLCQQLLEEAQQEERVVDHDNFSLQGGRRRARLKFVLETEHCLNR